MIVSTVRLFYKGIRYKDIRYPTMRLLELAGIVLCEHGFRSINIAPLERD